MAHRPIGYWLKDVDRLLDNGFEQALAVHDVGRRHWQVLTTLADGPASSADLVEALRPFEAAAEVRVEDVVRSLADRGWIARDEHDRWALTADGSAGHALVREQVHALRRLAVEGVSEQDYGVTIATLERMAANLRVSQRPHRPS